MADGVQRRLESMLDELDDALKKKIFTREEVKTIVKKRTKFEYALRKRPARLFDFLNYIQYEIDLDQLRKKKISKIGLTYKFTAIDFAGPKRIHYLIGRALTRFPGDLNLWQYCIDVSKQLKSNFRTSTLVMKALQLHPFHVPFWLHAVAWSFEEQSNVSHARRLFQKAVKLNPTSLELWVEWFKMEINQAILLHSHQQDPLDYTIALLIYQQAQVQSSFLFHEKCLDIAWHAPNSQSLLLPTFQQQLLNQVESPSLLVLGSFISLGFLSPKDSEFTSLLHKGFDTLRQLTSNSMIHLESLCLSILTWITQTSPRCTLNQTLTTYLNHQYNDWLSRALTLSSISVTFYHFIFNHPSYLTPSTLLQLAKQAHQLYPNDETCMKKWLQYQSKPLTTIKVMASLKSFPNLYIEQLIQKNANITNLTVAQAMAQCREVQPTPPLVSSILKALPSASRKEFQSSFTSTFVTDVDLLFPFLDFLTSDTEKLALLELGAQRHPDCVVWWGKYLEFMLYKDAIKATLLYSRALNSLNQNELGKQELTDLWNKLRE